jgi:hypothetical protein
MPSNASECLNQPRVLPAWWHRAPSVVIQVGSCHCVLPSLSFSLHRHSTFIDHMAVNCRRLPPMHKPSHHDYHGVQWMYNHTASHDAHQK